MRLLHEFVLCVASAFVLGTSLAASCEPDGCEPAATRCYNNAAEICGSDQNWNVNLDCDEVGGDTQDWVCCWIEADPDLEIPAGHGCLPGRECPAATDGGTD